MLPVFDRRHFFSHVVTQAYSVKENPSSSNFDVSRTKPFSFYSWRVLYESLAKIKSTILSRHGWVKDMSDGFA